MCKYAGENVVYLIQLFMLNSVFLAVSDYVLEEEAREYVNSVHIEDDPVDKFSVPEPQQQHQEVETEIVVEETPAEELSAPVQAVVNAVQENPSVIAEEPAEEPKKKTWASIVCTETSMSKLT